MFAKVELWLVLLLCMFGLIFTISFGWAVFDTTGGTGHSGRFGKMATAIAEIPETARHLLFARHRLLADHAERLSAIASGWSSPDGVPVPAIDGYLLLTRYDGDRQRSVIQLVSLTDWQVKHEWWPDADSLLQGAPQASEIADFSTWNTRYFRSVHPLLLPGGDLIVKDQYSPLLRIDACAAKVWREDSFLYSHSTEPATDTSVWVVADPFMPERRDVPRAFYDDSIALVSTDGKVLESRSMTDVLYRHGFEYLMFGAGNISDDPLHINDIEPALADGPYWRKGDVFISFRHLSMLMLYRPSTDEILWDKAGPWIGQHDVDILNDHQISVFSNNAVNRGLGPRVNKLSEVMVYDFATDQVTSPWHDELLKNSLETYSEGLTTLMSGGYRYVEENNSGRALILSPDGRVVRQFVNRAATGAVYQMDWSRFVSRDLGDRALAAMHSVKCPGTP